MWNLINAVVTHDIASLASVIAFYAFFSMFPLLLLVIYAMSVFFPPTSIDPFLVKLLGPYFPALPETKRIIIENVANLSEVGAKVGLLSALTLTWSATSGFIAVQQAMDVIWGTQQRSFLTRRLISFLMLVILMLLTIGSAVVMTVSPSIQQLFLSRGIDIHWITVIHSFSRVLFPLSLFFGFVVFYQFLPSRRSDWNYVIPGALVATLALDLGRKLFVWYASHLVRYQMIYGTLFAVMLLILWMYIGSILMLFGAEVSAVLEGTIKKSE
jgi:membrane protein